MTIQEPDRVLYKRRKYELVLADSDGLFDPEQLDLELRPPHTACWSGYIATYVVKYGDLLLRDLDCWIDPDSPAPSIGGHLPAAANEWGELAYTKLEIPMPYTGQLVLGGGEILGPFSYEVDWSIYELVHELHFEQGHLVEAIDLSAEAAQRRSPTVWD
jgi:hypothetical protein